MRSSVPDRRYQDAGRAPAASRPCEAERDDLQHGLDERCRGQRHRGARRLGRAGSGNPRRAACADGTSPEPEISSTSCSCGRSSRVDLLTGQRARDIEQQPGRENRGAGMIDLAGRGTRRPTSMSVASSYG